MLKYPNSRGLILRKTQESLSSSALVTYEQHVAPESLLAGDVRWFGGSKREPAGYRYSNKSRINVGGMNNPTLIMSTEYDMIYVQEAIEFTVKDWEYATTRLRNGKMSYSQLEADTNPDTAIHWLKQRADQGVTVMLESRHEDNPVYFNRDGSMTQAGVDYIHGVLDALTGVRHARLRKGLWVAAEGQIFDLFDPAIHVVDIADLGPFHEDTRLCARGLPWSWPRWWSIDFGYTNPTVIQRWAEDPDGRLILYAEQYYSRRLVEDHVKTLKAQVHEMDGDRIVTPWAKEPQPGAIIADHDAEDRATFTRHFGQGTNAAKKTVKPGLQATQARFKVQPDGRPRIYFVRDALCERDPELAKAMLPTCTIDELPGYVWNEAKDAPVKENDHGCDPTRYVVAHRDMRTAASIRILG